MTGVQTCALPISKGQIKRVLALLKKMREDVDVQIADEKEKQEQLAVETEL